MGLPSVLIDTRDLGNAFAIFNYLYGGNLLVRNNPNFSRVIKVSRGQSGQTLAVIGKTG